MKARQKPIAATQRGLVYLSLDSLNKIGYIPEPVGTLRGNTVRPVVL